jgi:hypothetical protein
MQDGPPGYVKAKPPLPDVIPPRPPEEIIIDAGNPVYNALFSPVASLSPLVLDDHKPTSITFYIGPKHTENVISPREQQVSPNINKRADTALMVTMKCLVCLENSLQIQPIQYSGSQGRSTSATFDIVPNRDATENKEGFGHITFLG